MKRHLAALDDITTLAAQAGSPRRLRQELTKLSVQVHTQGAGEIALQVKALVFSEDAGSSPSVGLQKFEPAQLSWSEPSSLLPSRGF